MKAAESSADPMWSDAEEALRQASSNIIHRFLNWCFKLEHGIDGRKLRGYSKASSLKFYWTRQAAPALTSVLGEYKRVGVSEFDSIGNKSLFLDEIMRVTHARLRELRDRNSGHQPRLESTGPHHLQSRVKKSDISSSKLNYPNIGF
jgi:hypothetical protein